jgi:hypothetical protein
LTLLGASIRVPWSTLQGTLEVTSRVPLEGHFWRSPDDIWRPPSADLYHLGYIDMGHLDVLDARHMRGLAMHPQRIILMITV